MVNVSVTGRSQGISCAVSMLYQKVYSVHNAYQNPYQQVSKKYGNNGNQERNKLLAALFIDGLEHRWFCKTIAGINEDYGEHTVGYQLYQGHSKNYHEQQPDTMGKGGEFGFCPSQCVGTAAHNYRCNRYSAKQ